LIETGTNDLLQSNRPWLDRIIHSPDAWIFVPGFRTVMAPEYQEYACEQAILKKSFSSPSGHPDQVAPLFRSEPKHDLC
jgi:hypothetical protein